MHISDRMNNNFNIICYLFHVQISLVVPAIIFLLLVCSKYNSNKVPIFYLIGKYVKGLNL